MDLLNNIMSNFIEKDISLRYPHRSSRSIYYEGNDKKGGLFPGLESIS